MCIGISEYLWIDDIPRPLAIENTDDLIHPLDLDPLETFLRIPRYMGCHDEVLEAQHLIPPLWRFYAHNTTIATFS